MTAINVSVKKKVWVQPILYIGSCEDIEGKVFTSPGEYLSVDGPS